MGRLLSAVVMAVSLDQVRAEPRLAADPAAIDALVHDADAMPPGVARAEARMFAANAYAQRLDRPAAAVPLYRKVAADPADPVLAHAALDAVVELHLSRADVGAARADLARLPDPRLEALVRRAVRRRYVHFASIFVIGATVRVTGAARTARGIGRVLPRRWPLALGFAAFVAVGRRDPGECVFGGHRGCRSRVRSWRSLPLVAWAMMWREGPRALRAAACGASVLAAAFLVLERYGQLDGLGL